VRVPVLIQARQSSARAPVPVRVRVRVRVVCGSVIDWTLELLLLLVQVQASS